MGQNARNARPPDTSEPGAGRRSAAHRSGAPLPPLAEMFAAEPELISACLHGAEAKPPTWARTVFDAARQALTAHPHYADLHYHGSHAAIAAGEYDFAAHLLAQALRENAGYRDARVLAGRVALVRRRPQEARAHLETALAQGADYPDVHLLLGDVWRECGNWSRARRSFERALELNASLTAARAALAALPTTDTTRGDA